MSSEALAFLLSVLCGAGFSLMWAVSDAIRHTARINAFMSVVLDFLLCAAAAGMFFVCIWQTVSFQIRLFELIGALFGALICYLTLYKLLFKLFCFIFKIIFKFIEIIFKILLTPCAFLYKILVGLFCIKGKVARYGSHKGRSD